MLQERIDKDYIEAMKAKDKERSGALSFLRAQLKNAMIDLRVKTLDDAASIAVIRKQVKQRQDSIEQYEKGNRPDLVQKERTEMDILTSYLPKEMSDAELESLIRMVISDLKAQSMKDMGQVMKVVIEKASGQADNKKISQFVKERLSQL